MEDTTPNVQTTPFVAETRNLANECLERYQGITGRILDSETLRADQEAWNLIRTGFSHAIREAERSGRFMLALHFGELLNAAKLNGCYVWLNGLAIDGNGLPERGLRPIGEIIQPVVDHVRAVSQEG